MLWQPYLAPVADITAHELKKLIADPEKSNPVLVDVRNPEEYSAGHIPGARLIPLPVLGDRPGEINPDEPVIVYCASGGRSRAGAQILTGKGFGRVLNLKGGFNAWEGIEAFAAPEAGMKLFSGLESVDELLSIAFGMEAGLQEFYTLMSAKVQDGDVAGLLGTLAAVEAKHKDRVYGIYVNSCPNPVSREVFESEKAVRAMEGGMEIREYLDRTYADLQTAGGVLDLAMAIEGQALDLYLRALQKSGSEELKLALASLAADEKEHLRRLGEMMSIVLRKQ